ncbi:MAG: response regulator transcription factor [Caldilineaceae bacterium]
MTHIFVVDDDPNIRELVTVFLHAEGFTVTAAVDGLDALAQMAQHKADLVILDVMMPNMDGWELCRTLRASYDIPLLMLTAKGETAQKVKGFELGTDDYLVKPFEPVELVMRVKALLKRYRIAASQTVQIGELVMDRKTFEVTIGALPLTLPLKEFELLLNWPTIPTQTLA